DNLDGRIYDQIGLPKVNTVSWLVDEKQSKLSDLSSSAGLQTGQYRLFLALGFRKPLLPPMKAKQPSTDLHKLAYVGAAREQLSIIDLPPSCRTGHIAISLKGEAMGTTGTNNVMTLVLIAQGAQATSNPVADSVVLR